MDYWNRLGWKDPYSQASFSERQRWYAAKLDGRVYTPELVVNGKKGIVGSQANDARKLVTEALNEASGAVIEATFTEVDGLFNVQYSASGMQAGWTISAALVQKETENAVPRSENSGKNLHHVNMVRALTEQAANASGMIKLDSDGLPSTAEKMVIVFLQDPKTGEVHGVTWAVKG